MAAVSAKRPQILQLTPTTEVTFEGPFDRVVTSYLELKNPSEQRVMFKVKTTAPKSYCVRPNSGVVAAGGKIKIAIMLQPDQSTTERSKHKFMVQSTVLGDDQESTDWSDVHPDKIMDSKLRCTFQMPPTTASPETAISSADSGVSTTTPSTTSQKTLTTTSATLMSGDFNRTVVNTAERRNLQDTSATSSSAAKAAGAQATGSPYQKDYSRVDRSTASSHNLTSSSFLQQKADDYFYAIVCLAMLLIGVILGKYIL